MSCENLLCKLATGESLEGHTCEACKGAEGSGQLLHYRTKPQVGQVVNSRLILVARPSRQNALFVRNLTFHISHTPYYKYPYTHEM